MWALGVVAYMLLSGKRPFHHQDRKEKARMICHDPLRFPSPDWDRISDAAKDFCSRLMQKNPKDRMPASDAVHHPWIKQQSELHAGLDAAHELVRRFPALSTPRLSDSDPPHSSPISPAALPPPPNQLLTRSHGRAPPRRKQERHSEIVDSLAAFAAADDLKRVALEVIAARAVHRLRPCPRVSCF